MCTLGIVPSRALLVKDARRIQRPCLLAVTLLGRLSSAFAPLWACYLVGHHIRGGCRLENDCGLVGADVRILLTDLVSV